MKKKRNFLETPSIVSVDIVDRRATLIKGYGRKGLHMQDGNI